MPEWESELNEPSRHLLAALRQRASLIERASMRAEPDLLGGTSVVIKLPSPTGDPHRDLGLWLDEKTVPSIEFGAWHGHADLFDPDPVTALQMLLDYAELIIDGRIALLDVRDADGWPYTVLDTRSPDDVLDELSFPGSPDELRLLSWSGSQDSVIDLDSRRPA